MKIALIRVAERLQREGSDARMLLTVHDELLLEIPRAEVERTAPVIRDVERHVERHHGLHVVVDLKTGNDWDSLTPLAAR